MVATSAFGAAELFDLPYALKHKLNKAQTQGRADKVQELVGLLDGM